MCKCFIGSVLAVPEERFEIVSCLTVCGTLDSIEKLSRQFSTVARKLCYRSNFYTCGSFEDVGGCVFVLLVDFINQGLELDFVTISLHWIAEFKIHSVVGIAVIEFFSWCKLQWLVISRVLCHDCKVDVPIPVRFV